VKPVDITAAGRALADCRTLLSIAENSMNAAVGDPVELDEVWLYVHQTLDRHLDELARALDLAPAEREKVA
jgi:hypothetical protein